jgi:5-dehydro-4-deoxyglucarate dehydratase
MVTLDFSGTADGGPLFFPVTPFDGDGDVDLERIGEHVESRLPYGPAGVFVACGTGEFFSLGREEYERAVAAVVEVVDHAIPVVAGVGYGGSVCEDYLAAAHRSGADGVLAFPPYSTVTDQDGLIAHYAEVARRSPLPVVVYQRDHVQFTARTAEALAGIANIIGLKDGLGDMEALQRVKSTVGARWSYFNGMPTAELSSAAFVGLGIPNYSSAVFAFLPELAVAFYQAQRAGDRDRCETLLRDFYLPFADLRDKRQGYGISLIKAGLRLRGYKVGSVRPPLVDPSPEHERVLEALIELGLQLATPRSTEGRDNS